MRQIVFKSKKCAKVQQYAHIIIFIAAFGKQR
jgi:hypothetical protein